VSPDNIIVPLGDVTRAKIIDFGIARSAQFGDKTIIGSGFAGKANFVSPEQVGLYGNEVTAKSDIYSLGLLLFYSLTGQKLDMGGSQFQLVEKRRRVPDLGGVDARIRPLLERMMQPDPANRPASMAEILNWQISVPRTDGTDPAPQMHSLPIGKPFTTQSGHRALWMTSAVAAVAVLLAAGGYGFYSFVWSEPKMVVLPPPPLGQKSTPIRPEPNVQPALAPTMPGPPKMEGSSSRADQIRKYVEQYDGGDCFFMLPVAISSAAAVIEGFGTSTAPFDTFERAFKRDMGFEAAIGVRQVTQAQCPAIKFLSQLGTNQARAPRINLASVEVKDGETLNGSIENFANRIVELLLVSENGQVQSLSYLLKPGTDSLSFSIGMQRGGAPGAGPQLIMAVATTQVIASLRQPRPMAADTFFLQALSEAQRNNLTISTAARYIRLKP
jgi:hypothetical protein